MSLVGTLLTSVVDHQDCRYLLCCHVDTTQTLDDSKTYDMLFQVRRHLLPSQE